MSEHTNWRTRYPLVFVPAADSENPENADLPGMYIAASDRYFAIFMPIPSFETVSEIAKEEFEADIVEPIIEHFARAAAVYVKHMKKRGFALPLPEIPECENELDYAVVRVEGSIAGQMSDVADEIDDGAERFGEWFLFIAPPGIPMVEFLSSTPAIQLN